MIGVWRSGEGASGRSGLCLGVDIGSVACKVVVCDRYIDSNKAHQAARLADGADVKAFFRWIDRLEYGDTLIKAEIVRR